MQRMILALALAVAPLAGATPAVAQPIWWLALGGQAGVETGRLRHTLDPEAGGLVALGWHAFRLGAVLLGPEAEGSVGRASANLGTARGTVTIRRGRVGIRATWWAEDDEPRLVPWVRGGGVYRADSGRRIDDEGAGWYVGAGLDVRLSEHWTVGPFVTYEAVSPRSGTKTFLGGLALGFSY